VFVSGIERKIVEKLVVENVAKLDPKGPIWLRLYRLQAFGYGFSKQLPPLHCIVVTIRKHMFCAFCSSAVWAVRIIGHIGEKGLLFGPKRSVEDLKGVVFHSTG
ncbi:hypothetical protein DC007_14445, partial [Enterococcus faecalis]